MEQEYRDEGVARSPHVVHVLPDGDPRIASTIGTQLDRVDAGAHALRLLVLAPSDGTVRSLARLVNAGRETSALLVPTSSSNRDARRMATGHSAAAMTAETAAGLLGRSALKLDALEVLVLLEMDAVLSDSRSALETIVGELPASCSRIAFTQSLSETIDAFLDGFAHKAPRVTYAGAQGASSPIQYVVCDRWSRTDTLAAILEQLDPAHATVVALGDSAPEAERALASLGYSHSDPLVTVADSAPDEADTVVWFDAPVSTAEVARVSATGAGRSIALVSPDDLAAFIRFTAGSAKPLSLASAVEVARSSDERLRVRVRETFAEAGLHRELLALAPLFAEKDPAEVAAALARLVERGQPAAVRSFSAGRALKQMPGTAAPFPPPDLPRQMAR